MAPDKHQTPNTTSLFAGVNIPDTPTSVSSGIAMSSLTSPNATSHALTPAGAESLNDPFPELSPLWTEWLNKPLHGLTPPGMKALSDTASTLEAMQAMPISSPRPTTDSLNTFDKLRRTSPGHQSILFTPDLDRRLAAIDDLPSGALATGKATSTVSTHSRAPQPSPPSSVGPTTEAASTPTYDDIDYEAPTSPYVNTAFAIGSYIAYQFEGLSQEERESIAFCIGGCIAFGVGFATLGLTPALQSAALGGRYAKHAVKWQHGRNQRLGDEHDLR